VSNPAYPINGRDILTIISDTPAGNQVGAWTAGTQTATSAPGTIRIYSAAATELADGAVTATYPVLILLSRGGAN
jgi:hypothetical protein